MRRKIINVAVWSATVLTEAGLLEIGTDGARLGQADYVVETIGEPFTDDTGRRVVEITLLERPKT